MVKMAKIKELAEKFDNDVERIKTELKRVQSIKCRLKKQKAKATYEQEMRDVVAYEQALKEARDYLVPKKPTVTTMTWEQIQQLNYDETIKAIKSIQSKKCNVQYLTANIEENVEYQKAVEIERMLLEHKKNIKPIDETVVKKSSVDALIDHIENLEQDLDKDYVLELLKKLKNE